MQYLYFMFVDITKSEFTNKKKSKRPPFSKCLPKYPSNHENAIFSLYFNIFSHAIHKFYAF